MAQRFAERLDREARAVGLDIVGACGAEPTPPSVTAYREWLESGFSAGMTYMARPDRVARALDPGAWEHPFRGLIVAGVRYAAPPPALLGADDPSRGRIAAYARGEDYHRTLTSRLAALAERLGDPAGPAIAARACVDTAPILERDAALRAGIGFFGRNTMLIHPRLGSWLLLGEILVERPLSTAAEPVPGTCGQCRRCLDACPTGALPAPYVLNARRCLSYLTIENRGEIPRDVRPAMGNHLFGCDVCNDVCPYNRHARRAPDAMAEGDPLEAAPRLLELLTTSDSELVARYRRTPVRRAGRTGLLRNLCVAVGNWGAPAASAALEPRLADVEPLVRAHAAWALGRIGLRRAMSALAKARLREDHPSVRAEIEAALDEA